MAETYDAIVIGAGHNGLTCACYLADAGLRMLVLDRYHTVGGMTTTEEITLPGFRSDMHAFGYQFANRSVGEEWLLLEVGMTVLDRTPNYTIRPANISLTVPGGQTIPLPSVEEYRKADTRALKNRERVQRDSINYFPPMASQPCAIVFYPDLDQRTLPRDDVELSTSRACLGRLYFKVPGGITHGQYWLDVQFEKSVVRVPLRILTEDEEKLLGKNYKDIRKQVQDAFRPPKKK